MDDQGHPQSATTAARTASGPSRRAAGSERLVVVAVFLTLRYPVLQDGKNDAQGCGQGDGNRGGHQACEAEAGGCRARSEISPIPIQSPCQKRLEARFSQKHRSASQPSMKPKKMPRTSSICSLPALLRASMLEGLRSREKWPAGACCGAQRHRCLHFAPRTSPQKPHSCLPHPAAALGRGLRPRAAHGGKGGVARRLGGTHIT